jgi:uncharacterized protein (DUF488 family)
MKIFTLGSSNRSQKDFLEILKKYNIEVVCDVRHFPTSKLFPHFKKENLEKFLKENKIDYVHIEKLGGFREGGYESYMESKEFKEGLEKLVEIGKSKRALILCAEKFPWKCHRAFISRELEKRNFETIHIIEKEKVWERKKEPKEIKPICQKILKKIKK